MRDTVEYSRLLPEEDSPIDSEKPTDERTPTSAPPTARASGLPLWAFLGCLLCTLFNIYLLHSSAIPASPSTANQPPERTAPLPRPNQYIGLEKVNRTRPGVKKPDPLVNHPPILTQVSKADPEFVFPDEPHRWFTWVGTVSPDDRHFVVTKDIHTIAQFRVHDFGMESCQVVINIPTPAELKTAPVPPPGAPGNKTDFTLDPPRVPIQVWKLTSDSNDLNVRTLSWKTSPPRQELLGTLHVAQGERAATQEFPCPSDSLQTFEFTCANEDEEGMACVVDFWQDKKEPMIAAILLQHSTVDG